jgi:hypothetical protein
LWYLHNVYELPSLESTIRYLHAAAGFSSKATWLKAIRQGNYSTWPLINAKNSTKYFPKLEETQMDHMQGQRQGVQSTHPIDAPVTTNGANLPKTMAPVTNPPPTAHIVAHNVLIRIINLKHTLYTD